jgi:IS1 family transposase
LHNEKCIDYNKTGLNNIGPRGKYGKNKDRNLFGCRTCGKRFAETHNTAYFGLHCSQDLIRQIVHHAAEGVSVRATARLLSCDKNKINRVILKAGEHIMLVLSYLLRSLHMTEVQLDELWSFVQKKKSDEEDIGEHWIWTAVDAKTKLMISFMVGHRTLEDARKFLKDLTSRWDVPPLLTSDALPHYQTVIGELYSDFETPERTGLPGRPKGPIQVIHENIDYATVTKTMEGGKVVQVTRQIVFGTEGSIQKRLENSPSVTINTSYVQDS